MPEEENKLGNDPEEQTEQPEETNQENNLPEEQNVPQESEGSGLVRVSQKASSFIQKLWHLWKKLPISAKTIILTS